MAEATGIELVKQKAAALASYGANDLADAQKVSALVKTAKEINDQSKALKEQDTRVKDEFKRMCKPYSDVGKNVTCYDFDSGMKMTLIHSGGGIEINEQELLKGIYEMYGEVYGDKGGKAWRAYCAISDPMEAPRKLNPEKLTAEIARANRITSGKEAGEIMVTEAIVQNATTIKPPSLVAKVSAMSKGEKKDHEIGELTDVLKVG